MAMEFRASSNGATKPQTVTLISLRALSVDTGLTRHDLNKLQSQKDYWINRMNEVNAISDPELQNQANLKLIADMMEDPTMKKVCKIITVKGFGFAVNMLETMLP